MSLTVYMLVNELFLLNYWRPRLWICLLYQVWCFQNMIEEVGFGFRSSSFIFSASKKLTYSLFFLYDSYFSGDFGSDKKLNTCLKETKRFTAFCKIGSQLLRICVANQHYKSNRSVFFLRFSGIFIASYLIISVFLVI